MKIIFDSKIGYESFIDKFCPSDFDLKEHKNCGKGLTNLCYKCWEESGMELEIKNDQSTSKEMVLNLNDIIRVKFTEYGRDIYYNQWHDLLMQNVTVSISREYPKVDNEGYTDIQLWRFMSIYGKHLKIGMGEQIIENNNIYIKEEPIKMSSLKEYYERSFVDLVYDTVKYESQGLDSIYRDYIINLVGVMGLNALIEHKLVEGCGIINGRKLYVLCERNNGKE